MYDKRQAESINAIEGNRSNSQNGRDDRKLRTNWDTTQMKKGNK